MNLLLTLISIEIKSVLRNRYLNQTFFINLGASLIGFYYLTHRPNQGIGMEIYWILLLVALPAMLLTPFFFTKDGNIFQALLSRNIPLEFYILGKILPTILFSILYYIGMFLVIFQRDQILIGTFAAAIIYYLAFGLILLTLYSSYDNNKIDLSRTPMFNYQGYSFIKILLLIPIPTPLLFWDETRKIGIGLMALLGLLGLLFFRFSINCIVKNIANRKYIFSNL